MGEWLFCIIRTMIRVVVQDRDMHREEKVGHVVKPVEN